ncbi:glutathione-regulated potassium-efflux system ancillary protein KefF [Bordetella genomosp. 9]|uniref:Glutathione-regulated potassium-efflux system ancillary protein KefF n=1 Tax=Bordetella genomosp. 9 TaxID=1416803 RepID=A0A261R1Y5_9BORD|nr:glutathione-regulated potassium-efflux system oxidoreductase KefF [Bordetella genomosp. 9]OZI19038.1 glutathione-regulated potassium-efflux system ancillary protein KefF [Bordetella genomosp. 9]
MILIVYAHPYPRHSRTNRAMLAALDDVPEVRVRSLYDLYPDFHIDVAAEQAALADASVVVWQHPLHWYGAPALFRQWMDRVLEHGWAYGVDGAALRGKSLMWAVTTGGTADDFAHCADADLGVLAQPLRSAAELCGMQWLPPYAVHGAVSLDAMALATVATRYRDVLARHAAGNPATDRHAASPASPAMTEAGHG